VSEGVPHGVPQGAVCANHLETQAVATCQRCGTFVCGVCLVATPAGNFCPSCAPKVLRTPWEERSRIGWVKAFLETAKGTLFEPGRFFRLDPVDMGYGSPILWAMLCALIGGAFALVWGIAQTAIGIGIARENPVLGGYLGAGGENVIFQVFAFLASPILVVISLFIMGGLTHLCLMMVGGANRGFDTTLRVFAYCQTTQLLAIVPLLGPFIGFFWQIVISIEGLRTSHETTLGKAAAAVLIPVAALGACAIGLIVGFIYLLGESFGPS